MVGNWYCVPSSCGRVVYREYLPPVVRWRYPGEAWQEIEGDDFTIVEELDLSLNTNYQIIAHTPLTVTNGQQQQWNTTDTVYSSQIQANGIEDWYLKIFWNKTNSFYYRYPPTAYFSCFSENGNQAPSASQRSATFDLVYKTQGTWITKRLATTNALWLIRIEPVNPNLRKTICNLTITNNGQIVYEETRSVCPEVEQLPCRLSDEIKQITIEKIPYLERIEVIDYAYQNFGLNVLRRDIPNECLNIYNNLTTSIIPLPGGIPTPSNNPIDQDYDYGFIQQICSASNCPPPAYQVICDCNCESCPKDTCPVECGDHICCYDDNGIAVKSIPIDNYCGD